MDAAAVEICVLGPVSVRGAARPFTRAWTLDLVVYLSMHPEGAATDRWVAALWPDRLMACSSVHSTTSAARRALGRGPDGDHLPRARGRLRLARTVGSDWQRLVTLAAGGDPVAWDAALRLVRGRPFDGLRSPDWTVLEGVLAEVEDTIVDVAVRLSARLLEAGDGTGASRVVRRALRASPFDERLYRQLLRAADMEGNPAGVESVMSELVQVMGGSADRAAPSPPAAPTAGKTPGPGLLHPRTVTLYHELSRRGAGTGRPLLRL